MKRGISAGSVEPSASSMTVMSPVESRIPHPRAFPFPFPVLEDDPCIWPLGASDLDRPVRRVAVNDDHLGDLARHSLEDAGDVPRLIECGNDNTDRGIVGNGRGRARPRGPVLMAVSRASRRSVSYKRILPWGTGSPTSSCDIGAPDPFTGCSSFLRERTHAGRQPQPAMWSFPERELSVTYGRTCARV